MRIKKFNEEVSDIKADLCSYLQEHGPEKFATLISKSIDSCGPVDGKSISDVRKIIVDKLLELNKRILTER